jgi:peptide methionine sulfoxide reductase MsrB
LGFTASTAQVKYGNDDSCTLGRCRDRANCPNPRTENVGKFQDVCIEAGTERAYTSELLNSKGSGIYKCSCCGHEVFSSEHKYDSKTGWPSFYTPFNDSSVVTSTDYDMGYARVEVCALLVLV